MTALKLPGPDGTLTRYELKGPAAWLTEAPDAAAAPIRSRTAFAAAHVVADPLRGTTPDGPALLDWDATLAFRRHLWSYGLAVAEAMDTAQRGMGLTWETTKELMHRSAAEARACGGRIAVGVGTDHKPPLPLSLPEIRDAYLEQLAEAEAAGAEVILMASRHLAAAAKGPEDYAEVYAGLLDQVSRPVILHWLGPMFDPLLAGYWGQEEPYAAAEAVGALIKRHEKSIDGIKVSMLDADLERRLREALPDGVLLYTGDDFNYPTLIREGSHALLGIFDAIAPAAAAALRRLDADDVAGFDAILEPTVPLARHLFAAPTWYYKTGIVFLAWLAGHQEAFAMVGGLTTGRSLVHLAEALRLADAAGLLPDPELAASRMSRLLSVAGVAQ